MKSIKLIAFCSLASVSSFAPAAVIWDEAINGDLSGNRLAPTSLALALGTNTVRATTVDQDLEFFTITVTAGQQLIALTPKNYVGDDGMMFMALVTGPTFSEDPDDVNISNLLGWSHFGPQASNVGQNILPALGSAPIAIGFTGPLAAGQYTFWVQQQGPSTSYDLDFRTEAVPEPATMAALGAGLVALARRRSRR